MIQRIAFLFFLIPFILFSCNNPHTAFMGHWQQIIEYDDSTRLGKELFIGTQKFWVIDRDEEPAVRTYTIIEENKKEFNMIIEITNENYQVFIRYILFSDDRKEMRIEWSDYYSDKFMSSRSYGMEKYKRIDSKTLPDIENMTKKETAPPPNTGPEPINKLPEPAFN
jgi:hypothetical protein